MTLRTNWTCELTEALDGKTVNVAGWVHSKRNLGGIRFLLLRDKTGIVQVTAVKKKLEPELFTTIASLSKESVISVSGQVKKNNQAPNGVEIIPETVTVLNPADTPLPLDVTGKVHAELDTRLDNRVVDLRRQNVTRVFIIKDALLAEFRRKCDDEGFVEVHTPKIVAAGAEGGSTLFPIAYFDREAYLAQSPQLYKQMLMGSGLDRILEIAPAWRAEKSDTVRHLSEFISIDMEMAFIESEEDVMGMLERVLVHALEYVRTSCSSQLEEIGVELPESSIPFPRVTYSEAVELINASGETEVEWGEDLSTEAEKVLGKIMAEKDHDLYFITEYPSRIKPFYIMVNDERPEVCRAFDLEFRGMEITSGGQREHRHDVLVNRMKEQGLDTSDFTFYLDAFRFGMPPHGGLGLGIERVVQIILDVKNIRETVLFPRDRSRLVP